MSPPKQKGRGTCLQIRTSKAHFEQIFVISANREERLGSVHRTELWNNLLISWLSRKENSTSLLSTERCPPKNSVNSYSGIHLIPGLIVNSACFC